MLKVISKVSSELLISSSLRPHWAEVGASKVRILMYRVNVWPFYNSSYWWLQRFLYLDSLLAVFFELKGECLWDHFEKHAYAALFLLFLFLLLSLVNQISASLGKWSREYPLPPSYHCHPLRQLIAFLSFSLPYGSTPGQCSRLSRRINCCQVFHKVSSTTLGSSPGCLRMRKLCLQEITEVLGELTCQDVGCVECKRWWR